MDQESIFRDIVSEYDLEAPDKNLSADFEHVWTVKKDRMETATGASWTDLGWRQRSLQGATVGGRPSGRRMRKCFRAQTYD